MNNNNHYSKQNEEPNSSSNESHEKFDSFKKELHRRFETFNTNNLKDIYVNEFRTFISSHIGKVDSDIEGFSKEEVNEQRDLSIKFHWGHDHNFGEFSVKGRMGERHINVLANFLLYFPISIENFRDKNIFDIGCWTGGTTLLLNSLSPSSIIAIEEVNKYSLMVNFLIRSFGLEENVSVKPLSLYSCNSSEFKNKFDIAYFPGVIYHLSDPVLALRILYNSLRVNGIILIESAGINVDKPFCEFRGSKIFGKGEKENLNRGGWNWFLPSPSALASMMKEVGFDDIQTIWDFRTNRLYGYGRKLANVGICKAGLSVQDID